MPGRRGGLGLPARAATLCEPCRTGRPGRRSADLLGVDVAWRVLAGRCEALMDDYSVGRWTPSLHELDVVEGLARTARSETVMTAAHEAIACVRGGRLAGPFADASTVLRAVDGTDEALRPLRVFVDVLADDAPLADPTEKVYAQAL
ncbi:hypothetical protein [Streptomyces sp. NPDC047981]|uniref:hypothetical protein n=1 Tax=Streptomyces sp. NPDC047981 TaxID=3154610 RepID=UPI00343FB1C0